MDKFQPEAHQRSKVQGDELDALVMRELEQEMWVTPVEANQE